MSLSIYLSMSVHKYVCFYLNLYLSLFLSFFLSLFLSSLSIYVSIYLSIYLSMSVHKYVCFYLNSYLSLFLSFFLSFFLSLSIYVSIYLSIYVCSQVCMFLSQLILISLSFFLSFFLSRMYISLSLTLSQYLSIKAFYHLAISVSSIYQSIYREKLKNKVIKTEKCNVRKSRRYNVSVLMRLHQDLERTISSKRYITDGFFKKQENKGEILFKDYLVFQFFSILSAIRIPLFTVLS